MENLVNPNKNCCTLCSGDIERPNVWFQKKPEYFHQGVGRCILDELTFAEVYTVLLRNPDAKRDLLRITHDPDLIEIVGYAGFDFVMIDMEHSRVNPETMVMLIRCAEASGLTLHAAMREALLKWTQDHSHPKTG